jgi:hypothetical protein
MYNTKLWYNSAIWVIEDAAYSITFTSEESGYSEIRATQCGTIALPV